ncbi:MAG: LysR family transcriptional regulator [Pseudomonadota bacterium]
MIEQKTTLEQWQALAAVAARGSVTAAADHLGKSQSTVSYLIAQLQEGLGVALLVRVGRRAAVSPAGEVLLERAKRLLENARDLEALAAQLAAGREATVRLAVDTAFPQRLLIQALEDFERNAAGTRLEVHEAALSGVNDLLISGAADLAIGLACPPGYLADPLLEVEFVMVAGRGHRLAGLERPLSPQDLEQGVQVVIRDSGPQDLSRGWLSPTRRWSVSNAEAALRLIRAGLCFGRLPRHDVATGLASGELALLRLEAGGTYRSSFFVTRSPVSGAGPATAQLVALLKDRAAAWTGQ